MHSLCLSISLLRFGFKNRKSSIKLSVSKKLTFQFIQFLQKEGFLKGFKKLTPSTKQLYDVEVFLTSANGKNVIKNIITHSTPNFLKNLDYIGLKNKIAYTRAPLGILLTPKGFMTFSQALENKVGGVHICTLEL